MSRRKPAVLKRAAGTGVLLCALAACATLAADAGLAPLLGTWVAGDRAAQARYGRIEVRQGEIEWSGSAANPGCRVGYRLQFRHDMPSYPDALPGLDDGARLRRHQVFRLALDSRPCTAGRGELQFAIATDAPDRAELIGYDRDHHPVSWGHVLRPQASD